MSPDLSIYQSTSTAAIQLNHGARFAQLDQRNRNVNIQGIGNAIGLQACHGSQARYVQNKAHVLGDGNPSTGAFNDCDIKDPTSGGTKTWDEVQSGGTLTAPSAANNWIASTYNFSRLTAYDT